MEKSGQKKKVFFTPFSLHFSLHLFFSKILKIKRLRQCAEIIIPRSEFNLCRFITHSHLDLQKENSKVLNKVFELYPVIPKNTARNIRTYLIFYIIFNMQDLIIGRSEIYCILPTGEKN